MGDGISVEKFTGLFSSCLFRECSSGSPISDRSGALAMWSGGSYECHDCAFESNTHGSIYVANDCAVTGSNFSGNSGPYGNLELRGAFSLSVVGTTFEGNIAEDTVGSCVWLSVAEAMFWSDRCTFVWESGSSILFSAMPGEAGFGSACFIGDGQHIATDSGMAEVVISVTGSLCFGNSEATAISNVILQYSEGSEPARYLCVQCSALPSPAMSGTPAPPTMMFTKSALSYRKRGWFMPVWMILVLMPF
jgi:hypothetical protein